MLIMSKKFFWNNDLNIISNLVKTYFGVISNKYQLEYKDCPIFIKLDSQDEYKQIIGDCYKQILHLSTNNRYLGIMRPEFTYMISKTVNLNTKNLYYIGECYRNETTQFLRFQNFTQLGCEFFANSLNKSLINTIILMIYLAEFIKLISINSEVNYKLYVNSDDSFITKAIQTIFNKTDIVYNGIKRIGGNEHTYTNFCFEIHLFKNNKSNVEHEVVGGGNYNINYKNNQILACGFSIGLERLIYYLTYSENNNFIYSSCIQTLLSKINQYNFNNQKDMYIYIKNTNIINKINDILNYNGEINFKYIR
ncbi:histidyl-tRNA synthetase [uncultured bacterium]|nr:histidyl-tRNA synthetase [uncultured bacterium]